MQEGDLQSYNIDLTEVAQVLTAHTSEFALQSHPVAIVVSVDELEGNAKAFEGVAATGADHVAGKEHHFHFLFRKNPQSILDALDTVVGVGHNSYEHQSLA